LRQALVVAAFANGEPVERSFPKYIFAQIPAERWAEFFEQVEGDVVEPLSDDHRSDRGRETLSCKKAGTLASVARK
jgi:hypothetical protein